MQALLSWIADSILKPAWDWMCSYWKWQLAALLIILAPFLKLVQWLDELVVSMTASINEIVIPDLEAFSVVTSALATANHWFPVVELFAALALWLVVWSASTGYRFVKNWFENGW